MDRSQKQCTRRPNPVLDILNRLWATGSGNSDTNSTDTFVVNASTVSVSVSAAAGVSVVIMSSASKPHEGDEHEQLRLQERERQLVAQKLEQAHRRAERFREGKTKLGSAYDPFATDPESDWSRRHYVPVMGPYNFSLGYASDINAPSLHLYIHELYIHDLYIHDLYIHDLRFHHSLRLTYLRCRGSYDSIEHDENPILKQIGRLRNQYLRNGGSSPKLLAQMRALEEEALRVDHSVAKDTDRSDILQGLDDSQKRAPKLKEMKNVATEISKSQLDLLEPNTQPGWSDDRLEDEELRQMRLDHKKIILRMENEREIINQKMKLDQFKRYGGARYTGGMGAGAGAAPYKYANIDAGESTASPVSGSLEQLSTNLGGSTPVRCSDCVDSHTFRAFEIGPVGLKMLTRRYTCVSSPQSTSEEVMALANAEPDSSMYIPSEGFTIFCRSVIIGFAIFSGSTCRRELKYLKPHDCQTDENTKFIFSSLSSSSKLLDIPAVRTYRVFVDVRVSQLEYEASNEQKLIGWSCFDLFNTSIDLDHGFWKIPVFAPPIDFDRTTQDTYKSLEWPTTVSPSIHQHIGINTDTNDTTRTRHVRYRRCNDTRAIALVLLRASCIETVARFCLQEPVFDDPSDPLGQKEKGRYDSMAELRPQPAVPVETEKPHLDLETAVFASIGVQFDRIDSLPDVFYPRARVTILDEAPEGGADGAQQFITEPADCGADAGSHGWPETNSAKIFEDIAVSVSRRITIDIFPEPLVLQSTAIHQEDNSDWVPIAFTEMRLFSSKNGSAPVNGTPIKYNDACIEITLFAGDTVPEKQFYCCIDSARFLPDNLGPCCVIANVLTAKHRKLSGCEAEMRALFNPDTLRYFPSFDFHKSYQPSSLDPTAVIVFKMFGIDVFSKQVVLVGTALCNLFVDIDTGVQPQPKCPVSKLSLNEGAFSISLRLGPLPESDIQLTTRSMDNEPKLSSIPDSRGSDGLSRPLTRLPCATLLVRIVESSSDDAPILSTKQEYNTLRSKPSSYERQIYPYLATIKSTMTLRDILFLLISMEKAKRQSEQGLAGSRDERAGYGRCVLADRKDLSGDQAAAETTKKLAAIRFDDSRILDVNPAYVCPYDPKCGFCVSVDSANKLSAKGAAFALLSICPPAHLYHDEKDPAAVEVFADDLHPVSSLDMDSHYRSPVWRDGFHWYRRRKYSKRMLVVIDVRTMINISDNWSVVSEGWTGIPIFDNKGYVQYGVYRLPLFEGTPPSTLLKALETDNFNVTITAALLGKAIRYSRKSSSVLTMQMSYMPENHRAFLEPVAGSSVSSILPRKTTREEYAQIFFDTVSQICHPT
ncbi:uncharacterized protein BJ171DRAFT_615891 [Polychytrium aggregatum]|uniref:uncharacterized protein n=1 Tax=Polychytrium aggregatum TaxID=110093 RepID=UPI0022FEE631|nr:uncharacterized protein BJ171DRAFT_615891 [Polychytrium aggregatum]KAI9205318.1 hypothetical protein BJ171DRAFT_615891 [Polychytrium aggregatum]